MTRYLTLLLLFVPALSANLLAQDIQFEHLTVADGHPDGFLSLFLQDRQGFLWVGSLGGLSKYDGYGFSTYHHYPPDSTSLSDNWVTALYEDRQGMIWVGTGDGGLNRFDPKMETFQRFRHDPADPGSLSSNTVNVILEDRNGVLWVGTAGGLNRLDWRTGTPRSGPGQAFTRFVHDPDDPTSLSDNHVFALHEDREGVLWAGTGGMYLGQASQGGLNRFDASTGTFTRFLHVPDDPKTLIDSRVTSIMEDSRGTLYIGTCRNGLHRFIPDGSPSGGHVERLLPEAAAPSLFAPQGAGFTLFCAGVLLHEDASGAFWISTMSGGLNHFDASGTLLAQYRNDPDDPFSLSSNNVYSLYEDRQGSLWIGTFGSGVNKAVPSADRFRSYITSENIRAIHEDKRGRIWAGTWNGQLSVLDVKTGMVKTYQANQNDPHGLWGGDIDAIYEDREGTLWVGTQVALNRFDPATETFAHYQRDPTDPRSLSDNDIQTIVEDSTGTLWVGTYDVPFGGINRFDRSTGTFTRFMHDPEDASSLSDNGILTMYTDSQGVLWIGTWGGGLNRYDPETESFTSFMPGAFVGSIYEDPAGRLWVGAMGDGLHLFDRSTGQSTRYGVEEGRPPISVWSIAADDQGFLWLSLPNGLARFDPQEETFILYDEEDGFRSAARNPELALRSRSGMLFFGGINGVTGFYPEQIEINPHPPDLVITDLRIFDEPAIEKGTLPAEVRLDHDQNELTFEYVGLHFKKASRNQYKYRLSPYDQDWQEAGTQRTARYTNLSPGTYTFTVQASNSEGVWSETGASQRVTILPPWWRTMWAYGLYGLLFIAGVFAVDRIQRRRVIRKEREKTRERELAQAREIERAYTQLQATQAQLVQQEKLASLGQLTAGIAHEIKNPLNFVNNFAEVNEELAQELDEALDADEDKAALKEIVADLMQNATVIAHHGKRADAIVHAMMQHASGGTGQREETDLNGLVSEHIELAYHGKRAQVTGFNVTINRDLDEEVGTVEVVPQEIGRVMLNLLSNAFDAVHEHAAEAEGDYLPTVTVSTRQVGDEVEVRVSDNGMGVPREARDKIFEPFYTTKPTGSGTGLGLSLSYDIVTQGHGGTLTAESGDGTGATFVITLPIDPNT